LVEIQDIGCSFVRVCGAFYRLWYWKSLLALGISGGLLPCPSALVMLLSASALGNVGLGMTLVVAFSLGLAERAECDRINLSLCQTEF
jgi:sulfite exporter TauE/SafE